jgi:hypothetical protein
VKERKKEKERRKERKMEGRRVREKKNMAGKVAQICNPSYPEGREVIRRIMIQGQFKQKVSETPILKNKSGMEVCNCGPRCTEGLVGGSLPEAGPRAKHETPSEKQPQKANRVGGMAQVIECAYLGERGRERVRERQRERE